MNDNRQIENKRASIRNDVLVENGENHNDEEN